jgi:hypothetical protein
MLSRYDTMILEAVAGCEKHSESLLSAPAKCRSASTLEGIHDFLGGSHSLHHSHEEAIPERRCRKHCCNLDSNAIEDPCTTMWAKDKDSILHVVQQCQRLPVSTRPLLHASSIPLSDDESTDIGENEACSSVASCPLHSHVSRAPAHLDLDYDLVVDACLRHWPREYAPKRF